MTRSWRRYNKAGVEGYLYGCSYAWQIAMMSSVDSPLTML